MRQTTWKEIMRMPGWSMVSFLRWRMNGGRQTEKDTNEAPKRKLTTRGHDNELEHNYDIRQPDISWHGLTFVYMKFLIWPGLLKLSLLFLSVTKKKKTYLFLCGLGLWIWKSSLLLCHSPEWLQHPWQHLLAHGTPRSHIQVCHWGASSHHGD